MDRLESKTERSMPIQSRVDLVSLAEVLSYWEKRGVYMRSMSQLISWSIDAFRDLLKMNKLIIEVSSLEDAYNILGSRDLIQKSMEKRMRSKYTKARGLENIRVDGLGEGIDKTSRIYQELHGHNQVKPFPGMKKTTAEEADEYGMSEEEYLAEKRSFMKRLADSEHERIMNSTRYIPNDEPVGEIISPITHQKQHDEVMTATTETDEVGKQPTQPAGKSSDKPAGINLDESQRLAREADERLKDF